MTIEDTTSVEETVKQITAKILHKSDFDPTKSFADLDADSLDIVQILVAVEDKYDIEVMDDELQSIQNLGEFVAYIERKIAEKG
jgi:acyl carrier protein